MNEAMFHIFFGILLLSYQASVIYRVRAWEVRQRWAGKSLRNGFLVIPVGCAAFMLGCLMVTHGLEILRNSY